MPDKKTISVFVAGADDCDELREIVLDCFEAQNTSAKIDFVVFDWRRDIGCDNFPDFQEEIFASAEKKWGKPNCDVLVLLLWTKFGKHTAQEYKVYLEDQNLSHTKLMACHYNGEKHPCDLEDSNIPRLLKWIKKVGANWGEISTERGSIKSLNDFHKAFSKRVSEHKDKLLEEIR